MTPDRRGPDRPLRLDELVFTNRFCLDLPADVEQSDRRRQVTGAAYSLVDPTPVSSPRLVAHAREVVEMLGLAPDVVDSQSFAEVFGGNRVVDGMVPHASCYGGHQFGTWAGQLGDGRAIALGEVATRSGDRFTLQLKGAGPTPYSRWGRRPSGVALVDPRVLCAARRCITSACPPRARWRWSRPASRSCATCSTTAIRAPEPGAIVCRVAPVVHPVRQLRARITAAGDVGLLAAARGST